MLFAEGGSDGLKAVAIATTKARHRTTKRGAVMVAVFLSRVASSAIEKCERFYLCQLEEQDDESVEKVRRKR